MERRWQAPVSWMTRGTSKTSCSHLSDDCEGQASVRKGDDKLGEHKWYKMPKMHAIAARPTPCVKKERLPLLISVKDSIEFADGEQD